MPDLSATQIGAVHSLLQRITPSLSLALSEQVNCEATLSLLDVQAVSLSELLSRTEVSLQTQFTLSNMEGSESVFLLSNEAACTLVNLMDGNSGSAPPADLTDAQIDTMSNGMSGLVRGFTMALTNFTGETYDLESSSTTIGTLTVPPIFALEGTSIEVRFALSIPDVLEAELSALFTTTLMLELIPSSDGQSSTAGSVNTDNLLSEDEVAAMLSEVAGNGRDAFDSRVSASFPTEGGSSLGASNPFSNMLLSGPGSGLPRGLDMILDIPLDVTVELGRVRMLIKDVLELSAGSIIELDRAAGEPVDLLVNGRLVAKGEVVVIEDNFGIRITEITSPADRVAGLGKGR
jgi:flagellar motor switch protein FliN/FliY